MASIAFSFRGGEAGTHRPCGNGFPRGWMKAGKVPAKTDCSEIDRDFSKPPARGQDAGAATTQGESAVGAPPDLRVMHLGRSGSFPYDGQHSPAVPPPLPLSHDVPRQAGAA